ncbi:MAG: nitroreductase [archaeon GW2011_AR9]|nr:MAG: nitroreductase [archaeon GW2011_AR9]MBS3120942.1 nitroreductase family protein [Candidatus Woesearchaeota archaeon]HIG92691.1 nitroreductase family protein [Candidatus Woesearchaeota archaeon]HIH12364.1 nitroreductase family protein [Candidatus Woesearchaeota archaeon]
MNINQRKVDYPVDKLFPNRWSPRALSGEPITDEELFTLFEAARWAPSSYNNQPWRFIYAKRDTPSWEKLFSLLGEFNQSWVRNAAVLLVIVSKKTFDHNGSPSKTHSFDTGAAWENLALQASLMGLAAHGMEGFDYDRAKKELHIPDGYQVEAMAAMGKLGKKEDLPAALQEREQPSDRKPIESFIHEGTFKA